MNKNIKRRMYALALASIMMILPKTKAFAEDVDMSYMIDIDKAISDLVPDDTPVTEPPKPEPETKNEPENNQKEEQTSGLIKPEENKETNLPENKNDESSKGNISNSNDINNNINNDNNIQNNISSQSQCEHTFNEAADDVINQATPSCTNGGSYDEVYYCTKCGATKLVHYEISAPGHNWGSEHIENETEAGYEVIRECTNKGCKEIWKKYIPKTPTEPTPTEPTPVPTIPTTPGKQDIPKTNDSSHVELAAAIMGISAFGLPIASYNLKQELEKDKKGKYLRKK